MINSYYPSMEISILDSNHKIIDFTNENDRFTTSISMETKYGKGIINSLYFETDSTFNILCSTLNYSTSYFFPYLHISNFDIYNVYKPLLWTIYNFTQYCVSPSSIYSNLPDNYYDPLDIMYCPIPNRVDNNNNITFIFYLDFKENNEYLPGIYCDITMNGTITGSIGKKYTVETNNLLNTLITITPDSQTIDELEENEYLIAYFEIEQTDEDINKELVILGKNEDPSISLNNIGNDYYSSTAINSHYKFNNGNLLLRYRETDREKKSRYWLAFKSKDPIHLQAYKRVISEECDDGAEVKANLNFIGASEEINSSTGDYDFWTEIVNVQAINTGDVENLGYSSIFKYFNVNTLNYVYPKYENKVDIYIAISSDEGEDIYYLVPNSYSMDAVPYFENCEESQQGSIDLTVLPSNIINSSRLIIYSLVVPVNWEVLDKYDCVLSYITKD